jgi:hypothetical protein
LGRHTIDDVAQRDGLVIHFCCSRTSRS